MDDKSIDQSKALCHGVHLCPIREFDWTDIRGVKAKSLCKYQSCAMEDTYSFNSLFSLCSTIRFIPFTPENNLPAEEISFYTINGRHVITLSVNYQ